MTYTDDEIQQHRVQYLEALRSGRYEQIAGEWIGTQLPGEKPKCCAGGVAIVESGEPLTWAGSIIISEWLGLEWEMVSYVAAMNDEGKSFKYIARFLAQKWGLK